MADQSFLIVRVAALGDVVLASPVVTRIRAEHPRARITWLVGQGAEPLVRLLDVDEVVVTDERALLRGSLPRRLAEVARVWRRLGGRRFDTIVLLHADRRYEWLLRPVRRGRMVQARHAFQPGGNVSLSRYRGDEFARLLDDAPLRGPLPRRWPLADARPRLAPSPTRGDARPLVVLCPGGARNVLREDALRRWPVESYRALAEALLRDGCEVALVGDAGDVEAAARFSGLPVTDHVGRTTLLETVALMRDADVVVTHDSGPLHFARLVRTPVVALFGPTDPRHFVGEDDAVISLWGGRDLACRPCYDGLHYAPCTNNLCIQGVSVADAQAAVRRLLAASGRQQRERGAVDAREPGAARV